MITAIALFAGLIPADTEKWPEKMFDVLARLLGVVSAFGAAWYTLDVATQGNPGLYLYGLGMLTGIAAVALLFWGSIWIIGLLVQVFFAVTKAAIKTVILCLRTVKGVAIIRGTVRRSLWPFAGRVL